MTEIVDIYLEEERYNPVCNATIPAAWIIETIDGATVAVARGEVTEEEARQAARNMGFFFQHEIEQDF